MGCGTIRTEKKIFQSPTNHNLISIKSFIKISKSSKKSQYKILKKIGKGSFSIVYLCSHKITCKKSAIKVIDKSRLSPELIDKVERIKEVAILSTIDHPNIIKCYEVFEDGHNIIISEEYISGGNLYNFCRSRSFNLPENTIASIFLQILSGLAYCHGRNIVHRDIKLENIFVQPDLDICVKIGDFGSAIKTEPNKSISGFFGSLTYMAPELFKDNYNEKIDIWSCGVLLYVLFFGKSPYFSTREEEIIDEVSHSPLRCEREEIQKLQKELLSLFQGLLNIDPTERFSAKEALMHPWLQKFNNNDENIHSHFAFKIQKTEELTTIQKTVMIYINSFLSDYCSIQKYVRYFKLVDKDGNGTIDKNELVEELKFTIDENKSKKIADKFFVEFDLNNSGVIDFMEFVTAFCDQAYVLSEKNLIKVFNSIDHRCKGFITPFDIENFFGVDFEFLIRDSENRHKINDIIHIEDFKNLIMN